MEEAVDNGFVRALGVSNFSEAHLLKLFKTARIKPSVNQIEVHPWLQRRDLCAFCTANGIVIEAYSPLAKANQMTDPILLKLAADCKRSPAQILLSWSRSKGYVPLPKSVTPARQIENLTIVDVPQTILAALDDLEGNLVTGWDPISNDPV